MNQTPRAIPTISTVGDSLVVGGPDSPAAHQVQRQDTLTYSTPVRIP